MDCPICGGSFTEEAEEGFCKCCDCGYTEEIFPGPDIFFFPTGSPFLAATRVYLREMHRLVGIWAIPTLLSFTLAFFILMAPGTTSTTVMWGAFSIQLVMQTIINLFFSIILIKMVLDVFETGETTLSKGFGVLDESLNSVLAVTIIFSFAISIWAVLGIVDPCLQTLICLPIVMVCYWWMFAPVILIAEGAKMREAFSASKEFAMRRSSMNFTIYIFIMVVILSIVVPSLTSIFLPPKMPEQLIPYIVQHMFQWLIFPFLITVIVAFYVKGKLEIEKEIALAKGELEEAMDDEEEDEEWMDAVLEQVNAGAKSKKETPTKEKKTEENEEKSTVE